MSERYIISPLEETDFRVEVDRLAEVVRARWPDADVRLSSDTNAPVVVRWYMTPKKYRIYCALDRARQALFLEGGDTCDCAQVALMFRELVPNKYKLFYYDQGFNEVMEITAETTEQDFIQVWGAGPS